MPLYEFKCEDCGKQYEELVINSDAPVKCPKCGSEKTRKLVSTFSMAMPATMPPCSTGGCKKGEFG